MTRDALLGQNRSDRFAEELQVGSRCSRRRLRPLVLLFQEHRFRSPRFASCLPTRRRSGRLHGEQRERVSDQQGHGGKRDAHEVKGHAEQFPGRVGRFRRGLYLNTAILAVQRRPVLPARTTDFLVRRLSCTTDFPVRRLLCTTDFPVRRLLCTTDFQSVALCRTEPTSLSMRRVIQHCQVRTALSGQVRKSVNHGLHGSHG
jgi:hypothetical protein